MACSEAEKPANQRPVAAKPAPHKPLPVLPEKVDSSTTEDGPPFREHCLCSFDDIARIRVSPTRYDIIISGKGWDPTKAECTWIWGEEIYNEAPPDSLISEQRIYLVDLPVSSQLTTDTSWRSSPAFKQHVIVLAVYKPDTTEAEAMRCIWDPYRTGRYPKPNW